MINTTTHLHSIQRSPSWDVALLLFQPKETFSFLEGQFMMIECMTPTWVQKKPYSIATTNHQLQEEKLIWFYIKQASEEGVSHYLTQIIKTWDEVVLKGPIWHYTNTKKTTDYLLISTWSGLSPNLWILEALLYSHTQCTIVSLFGERAREKMIDSCTDLLISDDPRLTSFVTYSKEWPVANHERAGYVQDHLDECLECFEALSNVQVFLCGRPDMVKAVESKLQDAWIPRERITTEKY